MKSLRPIERGGEGQGSSSEPVVSVIMIFLNARKYMAEAIESVLKQTLSSWELLLVDDGSSDGSREMALSYAADDPQRVRVIEHPGRCNRGTGPSRNLGMHHARGRYLAFLDADDVYEPHRLERAVELLEKDSGLGVVINRERYWREWAPEQRGIAGLARMPDEVIGPAAHYDEVIPPPVLIVSTLATRGAPISAPCSITFRKQAVVELGGIPDQFTSQYEDQALIVKLLFSESAVVIHDCLARYRQHPESLTHRALKSGEYRPGLPHEQRRQFVRWVMDYAAECGVDEPALINAMAYELAEQPYNAAVVSEKTKLGLRRAALFAANGILPRKTADWLIHRYLERKSDATAKNAMRMAATLQMRPGSVGRR